MLVQLFLESATGDGTSPILRDTAATHSKMYYIGGVIAKAALKGFSACVLRWELGADSILYIVLLSERYDYYYY